MFIFRRLNGELVLKSVLNYKYVYSVSGGKLFISKEASQIFRIKVSLSSYIKSSSS